MKRSVVTRRRAREDSMRPMTIGAFTRYKEQVENWLKAFVTSFTTDDTYASYWFHHGSAVVFSDRHKVTHFHEFEDRFRDFKAKIVQRKTAT